MFFSRVIFWTLFIATCLLCRVKASRGCFDGKCKQTQDIVDNKESRSFTNTNASKRSLLPSLQPSVDMDSEISKKSRLISTKKNLTTKPTKVSSKQTPEKKNVSTKRNTARPQFKSTKNSQKTVFNTVESSHVATKNTLKHAQVKHANSVPATLPAAFTKGTNAKKGKHHHATTKLLNNIGKRLNLINKLESKLKTAYKINTTNTKVSNKMKKGKRKPTSTGKISGSKTKQKIMVLISKNGNMISLSRFKRLQAKGLVKGITPVYVKDDHGRVLFAVPVAKKLKNKSYVLSRKLIMVSNDKLKEFLDQYNLDLRKDNKTNSLEHSNGAKLNKKENVKKTGHWKTSPSIVDEHEAPHRQQEHHDKIEQNSRSAASNEKAVKKTITEIHIGDKEYSISEDVEPKSMEDVKGAIKSNMTEQDPAMIKELLDDAGLVPLDSNGDDEIEEKILKMEAFYKEHNNSLKVEDSSNGRNNIHQSEKESEFVVEPNSFIQNVTKSSADDKSASNVLTVSNESENSTLNNTSTSEEKGLKDTSAMPGNATLATKSDSAVNETTNFDMDEEMSEPKKKEEAIESKHNIGTTITDTKGDAKDVSKIMDKFFDADSYKGKSTPAIIHPNPKKIHRDEENRKFMTNALKSYEHWKSKKRDQKENKEKQSEDDDDEVGDESRQGQQLGGYNQEKCRPCNIPYNLEMTQKVPQQSNPSTNYPAPVITFKGHNQPSMIPMGNIQMPIKVADLNLPCCREEINSQNNTVKETTTATENPPSSNVIDTTPANQPSATNNLEQIAQVYQNQFQTSEQPQQQPQLATQTKPIENENHNSQEQQYQQSSIQLSAYQQGKHDEPELTSTNLETVGYNIQQENTTSMLPTPQAAYNTEPDKTSGTGTSDFSNAAGTPKVASDAYINQPTPANTDNLENGFSQNSQTPTYQNNDAVQEQAPQVPIVSAAYPQQQYQNGQQQSSFYGENSKTIEQPQQQPQQQSMYPTQQQQQQQQVQQTKQVTQPSIFDKLLSKEINGVSIASTKSEVSPQRSFKYPIKDLLDENETDDDIEADDDETQELVGFDTKPLERPTANNKNLKSKSKVALSEPKLNSKEPLSHKKASIKATDSKQKSLVQSSSKQKSASDSKAKTEKEVSAKEKATFMKELSSILKESKELSKTLEAQAKDYLTEKYKEENVVKPVYYTKPESTTIEPGQIKHNINTIPPSLTGFESILNRIKSKKENQPMQSFYSPSQSSYSTYPNNYNRYQALSYYQQPQQDVQSFYSTNTVQPQNTATSQYYSYQSNTAQNEFEKLPNVENSFSSSPSPVMGFASSTTASSMKSATPNFATTLASPFNTNSFALPSTNVNSFTQIPEVNTAQEMLASSALSNSQTSTVTAGVRPAGSSDASTLSFYGDTSMVNKDDDDDHFDGHYPSPKIGISSATKPTASAKTVVMKMNNNAQRPQKQQQQQQQRLGLGKKEIVKPVVAVHQPGSRKSPITKNKNRKNFSKTKYFINNGILDTTHHEKAMNFLSSFLKHISTITHDPGFWNNQQNGKAAVTGSKRDIVLGPVVDEIERQSRNGGLGMLVGRIFDDDDGDSDDDDKDDGSDSSATKKDEAVTGSTRSFKDGLVMNEDDDPLESGIITMLQTDEDEKVILPHSPPHESIPLHDQ